MAGCATYFDLVRLLAAALRCGDEAAFDAALASWGPHQDAIAASCFRESARIDAWSIAKGGAS